MLPMQRSVGRTGLRVIGCQDEKVKGDTLSVARRICSGILNPVVECLDGTASGVQSIKQKLNRKRVTYHHVDPVVVSHTGVRVRAHLNSNGHDAVHLAIFKLEEISRQKVY